MSFASTLLSSASVESGAGTVSAGSDFLWAALPPAGKAGKAGSRRGSFAAAARGSFTERWERTLSASLCHGKNISASSAGVMGRWKISGQSLAISDSAMVAFPSAMLAESSLTLKKIFWERSCGPGLRRCGGMRCRKSPTSRAIFAGGSDCFFAGSTASPGLPAGTFARECHAGGILDDVGPALRDSALSLVIPSRREPVCAVSTFPASSFLGGSGTGAASGDGSSVRFALKRLRNDSIIH